MTTGRVHSPIQLSRRGLRADLQPGDFERLRDEWQQHQFMRLPQLFDAELVQFVQAQARAAEFAINDHTASGVELCMKADTLVGIVDFLMNAPELVRLAEAVTGCGHIGSFFGRIYRLIPGSDMGHDWHGDTQYGRQLGVSLNLTEGVFEGGQLELRDIASGRTISRLHNTGSGDCVIFRLGEDIEHRVLPVTGTVIRQAYAGWFRRQPEYAAALHA
ncbi:MAG: 2OG-Fe(II) oxygenase [Acidobacteriota bacterium]